MDTQTVEIIGRNYLISQLVRDGLEVARPERDRGVDLIAYLDLDEAGGGFVACPIQMKAATIRSFGLAKKYEKFHPLLFAHVWHVHVPDDACAYALTYAESFAVAAEMGWTKTVSWQQGLSYDIGSQGRGARTTDPVPHSPFNPCVRFSRTRLNDGLLDMVMLPSGNGLCP